MGLFGLFGFGFGLNKNYPNCKTECYTEVDRPDISTKGEEHVFSDSRKKIQLSGGPSRRAFVDELREDVGYCALSRDGRLITRAEKREKLKQEMRRQERINKEWDRAHKIVAGSLGFNK